MSEHDDWAEINRLEAENARLRAELDAERERSGIIMQAGQEVTNELRAELAAANKRIGWLEEHMRMIARIENKLTGGDWDEIEEARWIAWRALDQSAALNKGGGDE